ncbi:MAG: hypothetical protein Q9209_005954 [Squamulea sp. 1 TL-2023]
MAHSSTTFISDHDDREKEAISRPVEEPKDRRQSVPERVAKRYRNADEAMKAFADHDGETLVLDEATSKQLLNRIDLHLMPVSSFQFMSEGAIG